MSEKFVKKWAGSREKGIRRKVSRVVSRKPSLRRQLDRTLLTLQTHLRNVEGLFQRLVEKDRALFGKVVKSYEERDMARASMYAKEVMHVRVIAKNLIQVKLALEQVTLRLTTVKEIGDVAAILSPALGIIRTLDKDIASILPEAGAELDKLGILVSDFLVTSGAHTLPDFPTPQATEEARRILAEATRLAQEAIEEKFPKLPEDLPIPEEPVPG